ncbi:hypothetical protein M8J77_015296 [Diaphorina citri]|nr:hypothetical protein M8J77_015296 [Diaphorina citri]
MSFNKFMHPRNKYRVPPDFKQLAIEYPEFRKHLHQELSGKLKFNFQNPDALRIFTTTLLRKDFGLNVEIPPMRLVPTLPLRLNYILWIEDLLEANQISSPITGIDIGAGASCIYPLLSCKKNSWHMLALENDPQSYQCAQRNVEQNEMQDFIKVKHTTSSECDLQPYLDPNVTYSFTMCNPPFFSSVEDLVGNNATSGNSNFMNETNSSNTINGNSNTMNESNSNVTNEPHSDTMNETNSKNCMNETNTMNEKSSSDSMNGNNSIKFMNGNSSKLRPPPTNGRTGYVSELVVEGGEVAFVKNIVENNIGLKQIRLFTTMLGHKASFIAMKHFLHQHPLVQHYSSTEFCQGNTMRWGLAWTTHEDVQLRDALPRREEGRGRVKPLVYVMEGREGVEEVVTRLFALFDALKTHQSENQD